MGTPSLLLLFVSAGGAIPSAPSKKEKKIARENFLHKKQMAECIDLSIIDSPVSTKAFIETVEPGRAHDMPKKSLPHEKKNNLESKIATLTTSLSTVQSRIAALEKQLRPLKARQQSLIDHINSINEQLDFLPRSKVLHFFVPVHAPVSK